MAIKTHGGYTGEIHGTDGASGDIPPTFVLERRRAARTPASGPLQAVLANGREMPWVMRLNLVDCSAGGMCAEADAAVAAGARLSLRVDPVHGAWRTGVVVRCTPSGDGHYRLGISYDQRAAA